MYTECHRSMKQGVVHVLKVSGTFPSSKNMYSTSRDPQHRTINEDTTTLIVRRACCPRVLPAKHGNDRGRDAPFEQAEDSFYIPTMAQGRACLLLESSQVRELFSFEWTVTESEITTFARRHLEAVAVKVD